MIKNKEVKLTPYNVGKMRTWHAVKIKVKLVGIAIYAVENGLVGSVPKLSDFLRFMSDILIFEQKGSKNDLILH